MADSLKRFIANACMTGRLCDQGCSWVYALRVCVCVCVCARVRATTGKIPIISSRTIASRTRKKRLTFVNNPDRLDPMIRINDMDNYWITVLNCLLCPSLGLSSVASE